MRLGPPGGHHPEADLVAPIETTKGGVHRREVRALVARRKAEVHSDNKRAQRALPGAHPDREACLERGDLAGALWRIEHRLDALEQVHRDAPAPRRAMAVSTGGDVVAVGVVARDEVAHRRRTRQAHRRSW